MTETSVDVEDRPKLPFDRPGAMQTAPLLRELREQGPIVRVTTPTGDPAWLVVAYDEGAGRVRRPPPRLLRPSRAAEGINGVRCGGALGTDGRRRVQP